MQLEGSFIVFSQKCFFCYVSRLDAHKTNRNFLYPQRSETINFLDESIHARDAPIQIAGVEGC